MYQIIVQQINNQKRILVMWEKMLVEKYDIGENNLLEGNIYIGKVENVLKGMGLAFVNIGEEKNGILHFTDVEKHYRKPIETILRPGNSIVVQVKKDAYDNKGPKLTCNIGFTGKYIVFMPREKFVAASQKIQNKSIATRLIELVKPMKPTGTSAIIRTEAQNVNVDELKEDMDRCVKDWLVVKKRLLFKGKAPRLIYKNEGLIEKIIRDITEKNIQDITTNIKEVYDNLVRARYNIKIDFNEKIELSNKIQKELDTIKLRKIWLKSGAYITIDHTEALTAIDVNTAGFIGEKDRQLTFLNVNKEATIEIARQIRLRNISGVIIIDYINMNDVSSNEEIVGLLNNELRHDRAKVQICGFTRLQLLEMTRQRVHM